MQLSGDRSDAPVSFILFQTIASIIIEILSCVSGCLTLPDAPPGVFDMDGFHCAVHIYMGNKTVGAVKKNAVHDLSVFQNSLHFTF